MGGEALMLVDEDVDTRFVLVLLHIDMVVDSHSAGAIHGQTESSFQWLR